MAEEEQKIELPGPVVMEKSPSPQKAPKEARRSRKYGRGRPNINLKGQVVMEKNPSPHARASRGDLLLCLTPQPPDWNDKA